jgi:hypothetical protein
MISRGDRILVYLVCAVAASYCFFMHGLVAEVKPGGDIEFAVLGAIFLACIPLWFIAGRLEGVARG